MKKLSLQEWKEMRRRNPPAPVDWSAVWRRIGPTIIEKHREAEESLRIIYETYIYPILEAFQPGTDLGDLLIIGFPNTDEPERLEAVIRFRKRHEPIAWMRWKALERSLSKELNESANAHGRTFEEEVTFRTLTGLFIAAQVLADIPAADAVTYHTELLREIRRKLNDIVTEDILGEEWRSKDKYVVLEIPPPDEELPHPGLPELPPGVEAEHDLLKILDLPLEPHEKDLFTAIYNEYMPRDFAEETGKKKGTVRVALSRVREKVQKAFPEFSM